MIRRIALFLMFAFAVVLLGFGCGQGKRGTQVPDTRSEKDKEAATPSARVEGILGQIQDKENANRRARGAAQAAKLAGNPDLTVELKIKLVDALKKAHENEKNEDAKKAEAEALSKLEG